VTFAFWFFGGAAIVASFLCITRRSPVSSALWLITTLFNVAALFVLLDAHFLAAVQVLVYAGAIMVLFLFVIMLLNLGERDPGESPRWSPSRVVGFFAGLGLLAELLVLRSAAPPEAIRLPAGAIAAEMADRGAVQALSMPLFQSYLVPFEITSLMLLAAIVGAVVLAKRRL
jgi:NADH-quinone oxidoreductase subunit J